MTSAPRAGSILCMASREAESHSPRTANRVREIRRERGLTQVELVRLSGISRPELWRVETGRVQPVRATRMVLSAALGTDVTDAFPVAGDGEA